MGIEKTAILVHPGRTCAGHNVLTHSAACYHSRGQWIVFTSPWHRWLRTHPRLAHKPQSHIMIARIWHGMTRAEDYDPYWKFLHERAIPDYRSTPGNLGVRLFRRLDGDRAHFLTQSDWPSLESIRAFAGEDIEQAKYYAEDGDYLLEFEPTVQHYEVTEADEPIGVEMRR